MNNKLPDVHARYERPLRSKVGLSLLPLTFFLDFPVNLSPVYSNITRRRDTNYHLVIIHIKHGDIDIITDLHGFSSFLGNYQHRRILLIVSIPPVTGG